MSLRNTANAGRFSSDRTVQQYADDIWQIEPLFAHNDNRGVTQHDTYLL
ncbi:MAG: glycogen/starch/alpha-glucan phosphorylase [Enterococcus sp.]|nr:glycogen/starch/alpha-glucan phosphorylase [Enterococcus sp.]